MSVFNSNVFFAAATLATTALLVWLVSFLRTRRRQRIERVQIEDALKVAFNDEHAGASSDLGELAHALGWSQPTVQAVVDRMEELGLVSRSNGSFRLTDPGRERALHVLRSHRVWERYLSDRTNMRPDAWHDEADRREHELTDEETDSLASAMGQPAFDPHGDPIPTATGQLPPPSGVPLTHLEPGDKGIISHVEDEPADVYAEVVRAGLHPSTAVQMLERTDEDVRFLANGLEIELPQPTASQVTVWPAPDAMIPTSPGRPLSTLTAGATARVTSVSLACPGPQRRRLLDLGFLPGTEVRAELRSPSGQIYAYRVRGALIALRAEQAAYVHVDENGNRTATG